MRTRIALASLLALATTACDSTSTDVDSGVTPGTDSGSADTGTPTDGGGTPTDSGPGDDGGGTPVDGGGDVDGGGTPGCGGARPSIAGITGTEGLVIARDGTIYYSQNGVPGGVGRMTPGGAPEDDWVGITGAMQVWGLALDATNTNLYVGSPSTGRIYRIDLTAATPTATTFVMSAGAPNGLAIGPDGALYYSDFGADRVYRVMTGGTTGTRVMVTPTDINQANGLAFMDDGSLLVASYATGVIFRLTLTAGVETARTMFASGTGNPDGIAVDADGRVYVTNNSAGRVIRLEPDGSGPMTILMGVGAAAGLEFGAGALDCEDLYVTSSAALRRYEMAAVGQRAVPWH